MSKIGKISISIPEKVKVVLAGNIINIEGPLGKKSIGIDLETIKKRLLFNFPSKYRIVENTDANFAELSLEIFN